MLSYLLWEIHEYPSQPVSVEINGDGYRVIDVWQFPNDQITLWKPLSEVSRTNIEKVLEQANYWKWEREYYNSDIIDGTTWSIKVRAGKTGGRRKNSEGVNDYPQGWDEIAEAMEALKYTFAAKM